MPATIAPPTAPPRTNRTAPNKPEIKSAGFFRCSGWTAGAGLGWIAGRRGGDSLEGREGGLVAVRLSEGGFGAAGVRLSATGCGAAGAGGFALPTLNGCRHFGHCSRIFGDDIRRLASGAIDAVRHNRASLQSTSCAKSYLLGSCRESIV